MPNDREPLDLRALFRSHQKEMLAKLETAREHLVHAPTKGDATEETWVAMLNEYLPKRYHAAKATVVDVDGNQSHAIDVVIFDRQYSPFLLKRDGANLIPAESVYAMLEVKQELTLDHIRYAATKAESVRRLRRTSVSIVHAGGTTPPRPPPRILAGIVVSKSSWSPPFGKSFQDAILAETGDRQLDFGCALADGAFELSSKRELRFWQGDGLMRFFLTMLRRLQEFGTAPAMDLEAYARVLDSPPASK
jgi:hypothetical protein